MSLTAIRTALETALAAITPPIDTAREGYSFTPTSGSPYQRVEFLFSDPENTENTAAYRQGGYMQVSLFYSPGSGASLVEDRADLIRSTFPRGRAIGGPGVITTIVKTPSILNAPMAEGMLVRAVRIWFLTNVLA